MKVVDLFSGCGGMSLGFQNSGFNVVAAFDNWDKAIDIYQKNFNHPIFKCDLGQLEDFSQISSYNAELIIGGPPCQDFSSAGKRDESLGRSDLTVKYAKIVKEVLPKYFVMENVDRIEKSNAYNLAVELFKEAGYGLTAKILDASLCGVPQKRKRFFLIGELGGTDNALLPYLTSRLSKKPMTVRDYLGNSLGVDHYYRHPRNYNRRGIFSIDEPAPTVRGVNRPLPQGYPGHKADSSPVSENIRPLTTIERSYIQTFPTDFIFDLPKTHLEQLIGNAVPVKLAEYVANSLIAYIKDSEEVNKEYTQLKLFNINDVKA
ncbi:DNA cytosine methyltransferase [Rossellomorea marisflavi]|uniref:DNA cytosine methyltransferase n=1 Tax=Rossellomorea marisflavi TaxID=189381 RepID=UPI003D2F270E